VNPKSVSDVVTDDSDGVLRGAMVRAVQRALDFFHDNVFDIWQQCANEERAFTALHNAEDSFREVHFALPKLSQVEDAMLEMLQMYLELPLWEDMTVEEWDGTWMRGIGGIGANADHDLMYRGTDVGSFFGQFADVLTEYKTYFDVLVHRGALNLMKPRSYFSVYPSALALSEWHLDTNSQETYLYMGKRYIL
jgi:hypothetical protein